MKRQLLTTLLAYAAISATFAQTRPSVPRLVVGITIDKLRSDYLQAFSPLYSDEGFKKLLNEGQVYTNVQYPFTGIDRASAAATVITGTVPYNHGIISEKWMDRTSLTPIFCVDDDKFVGVNTKECSSPKNLRVSTLGDELKVATNGKAKVFSIAPYRETAVLSAGHAADWAIWIDSQTGKWAGTSYYGKEPSWMVNVHQNNNALKIPRLTWAPDYTLDYNYFLATEQKSFSHTFKGDAAYRQYKNSGLVNENVTTAAMYCISSEDIALDITPDFIAINYYAGNYDGKSQSETTTELQDTYIRLDKEIAKLLKAIDRAIGLDKTLIYVTSTGYDDTPADDLTKYRIPSGNFKINRCVALLNMYLTAMYGQGQYVESYYGTQIYLNHKFIEQKQLKLKEVLEHCEDFLFQFSGIRDVFTSQRLVQGAWTPGISNIRNGYNPTCSGDITIQVAPGWSLVNEDRGTSQLQRDSFFEFPLIFYGFDLEAKQIHTPVTVDCIAPTIAHHIRIRAPNACSTAPLF